FSAWLGFFKKLGEVVNGEWAVYRQALRDIPEQEGFPFDVKFPSQP
ncbi:MAG: phage tail assembly chaperone, partial [Lachnospirales bacterium]